MFHFIFWQQLPDDLSWCGGVANAQCFVFYVRSETRGKHFHYCLWTRVCQAHIRRGSRGQGGGSLWRGLVIVCWLGVETMIGVIVVVVVANVLLPLLVTDNLETWVHDRVGGVGLGGAAGAVDGQGGVETDIVRVTSPGQADAAVVAMFQHHVSHFIRAMLSTVCSVFTVRASESNWDDGCLSDGVMWAAGRVAPWWWHWHGVMGELSLMTPLQHSSRHGSDWEREEKCRKCHNLCSSSHNRLPHHCSLLHQTGDITSHLLW